MACLDFWTRTGVGLDGLAPQLPRGVDIVTFSMILI